MTAAHVLTLEVELRLPHARSLKDKRRVVRSLVDRAGNSAQVGAAEVSDADDPRRATVGFAAIGGAPGHVTEVIDSIERLCWSYPDADVVSATRSWLEADR